MAKSYFKSFYLTRQREGEGEEKVHRKYFLLSIFLLSIEKTFFPQKQFHKDLSSGPNHNRAGWGFFVILAEPLILKLN